MPRNRQEALAHGAPVLRVVPSGQLHRKASGKWGLLVTGNALPPKSPLEPSLPVLKAKESFAQGERDTSLGRARKNTGKPMDFTWASECLFVNPGSTSMFPKKGSALLQGGSKTPTWGTKKLGRSTQPQKRAWNQHQRSDTCQLPLRFRKTGSPFCQYNVCLVKVSCLSLSQVKQLSDCCYFQAALSLSQAGGWSLP